MYPLYLNTAYVSDSVVLHRNFGLDNTILLHVQFLLQPPPSRTVGNSFSTLCTNNPPAKMIRYLHVLAPFLVLLPVISATFFCPSQLIAIGNRKSSKKALDDGLTQVRFKNGVLTPFFSLSSNITGVQPSWTVRVGRSLLITNAMSPNSSLTQLKQKRLPPFFRVRSALGSRPSGTHLSLVNGVVVVANFGGSVDTFSIRDGVRLLDSFIVPLELASQLKDPTLPKPFDIPHPHMAFPYGFGVLVPDVGSDLIFYLRVDRDGSLSELSRTPTTLGDGPRHVVVGAFHTVYVVTEASLKLLVMKPLGNGFNIVDRRELTDVVIPPEVMPRPKAAAIRLSRDRRFLYVSVRLPGELHGRISGFQLNAIGNVVGKIGEWDSCGVHPRDFIIVEDRCGSWMLIANRDTGNVVAVKRDIHTGMLGTCGADVIMNRPGSVAVIGKL